MTGISWVDVAVGDSLPELIRTTGLANWNRYAAVNDEFIPIHMDPAAAHEVGMPDVFGMGNLRISYLHNMLQAALGGAGDIADFRCEFRGMNFRGDVLTSGATVTAIGERDRLRTVDVDLHVTNQDGTNTTPGSATLVLFDGEARMPEPPTVAEPSGEAAPGQFLTQATIDRIGTEMSAVTSPPVGANDIARWAIATHWPEPPPPEFLDAELAAAGPWVGIVAPRELDPFAWMLERPWSGDWLLGMGSEPGTRVLNGGQRNLYFAPVRPGDEITVVRRFVDVVERETKRGPMVFFESEFRLTNQHDSLVRIGTQTTIYY